MIVFGELLLFYILYFTVIFVSVKNRSPAARRRHRQQQEEQHRFRHQLDRKLDADSPIFFRPLKAYQIYNFYTNGPRYSNNNNERYSRLKIFPSILSNSIQFRMIEKATPSNYSMSTQTKTDPNEIGGILHSN